MQVLVRLHPGNFQFFMDTLPDGAELRFLAGDDKTPLSFHVEKYDPVAEMGLVWVGVPRSDGAVASGPTTWEPIWMYYGNQNAPVGQTPADSFAVSDALVYRYDETLHIRLSPPILLVSLVRRPSSKANPRSSFLRHPRCALSPRMAGRTPPG
jgi:hypothetical protein